ncbi:Protein RST1 [Phytophthora ramorum]|uniref:Protein RST1 n=1 Tax=Phytophthora ramorum TaxID=164328 RepID=UPI0030AA9114|nr:Protein RST1 [Phytophthora ramorum]
MASTTATLAALLRALRQASTAPAASDAMDQSVDRLISTSSLSEAQNLVFGLLQCAKGHHSAAFTESLHGKLQQAAAICTEPSSKAQYLGFVLLEGSVHLLETLEVSTQRQVLLQCFNANKSLLSGYVAALTAADGPFWGPSVTCETAKRTLHMVAPVLKTVLMDNSQTEGHKAAVLDALCRIAWHFGDDSEDHEAVRTSVVNMLVQALELVPHSRLAQTAYVTHVALIVDLLSTLTARSKEQVALAKRTARFVLESTQILIGQDVGVIALLQSLEQLAQAVPEAFWCSVFLASTAYFLVDKCETPLEQQLVLRMLAHALTFGREVVSSRPDGRGVYVEILLLPLSSMIALHGSAVSELLKLVMEIKSATTFHPQADSGARAPPTKTATHARSAVRLISDEDVCRRWLDSLFPPEDAAHSDANNSTDKWLALLLVALLSDGRSSLRGHAAKCFERQVNSSPKFWGVDSTKSLVASLVFLVSQHPPGNAMVARHFGEWLASCLYSLAALAATTTDTMRIVLRLIDSMNGTTKMRPMALKLMYEVWRHESRVFPRLESMLLEATARDEDAERRVVKMATVKMLCEEDPELGVQFISSIQGFLEDELESVVSMAMDAITALCGGDCLDFYVAFKIIAQKMRKNKVGCADEPLFQERLCCFYALGGAESAANEKHASKLLSQAWEFADSEHPSVRKAAYAAMSKFPLGLLGLSMPADGVMEQDSDEEDQVTEEEVEEQLDDLMQRLQSEHDADVRSEIEKLMTRVIEHESAKLTVGVGRGQRMASAASGDKWQQQQTSQQTGSVMVVSAAATKEMKALLPSRAEVLALFSAASSMADWSGFLLAYQPKAAIDTKNVKRKDKLVRLATQNVDELVETVGTVLQSMELPWASTSASTDADSSCEVFLLMQALMKGWRTFMATYIASLDELAELKTPVGVDDADVAFRVFSEGVASLIVSLLRDSPNTVGGTMAVGALLGQLCETRHWQNPQLRLKYEETVEELSRRLALSIEQARVFSVDDGDFRSSSIGASIALQLSFGRRKVDAGDDCSNFCLQLEKIEQMFKELYLNASDELLRASALFGLSHIGALYTNSEDLETFETTQWRQQRVKPIAELVFSSFLQNYASLTHRVMMRFCSVETSVACVRFAATQGSCDELLAGELLSSTWFGNVDTAVQTQLIGGLSRLATRVPTDVLRALLVTIFDVLKDIWRCEVPSSSSAPLFDSWTSMLSSILDATPSRRISETSLDMVNQLVLEKIVVELPFGLEASHFVEQFAIRVLSKVNYGEPGPVGAFLMPSGSNSSTWSWWRSGVFVVELAHLNVQAIGKREASLLFQWILRHEFDEWTDGNLVDTYLQPLIARVGALVAQHTRPGDNVSSLLDVLDAFSRGMASLDFSVRSDEIKRRALFDVVACVLSWNLSLSHEKFMAKLARSEVAGINTATDLLPFGLTLCAHSAKSVSALGERLLALLQQLARLEAAEAAGYSAALQVCSRQMHIAADSWHTPSTMQGEIREFWSMSNMD